MTLAYFHSLPDVDGITYIKGILSNSLLPRYVIKQAEPRFWLFKSLLMIPYPSSSVFFFYPLIFRFGRVFLILKTISPAENISPAPLVMYSEEINCACLFYQAFLKCY